MNERREKKGLKRLPALLLIVALLLPTLIAVRGALVASPDESKPTVTVVSTLTEGGQYLEVGLNIDSKEGGTFQSAGVLLQYDPDKLTPIQWGEVTDPETGAVPERAKIGLADAKGWDSAAILPTKGADALSGKLAEAFVSADGKTGYLYLSAEAARTMKLAQTLPTEANETPALPEGLPDKTTSGQTVSYRDKAETAAEQATTVRFLVNSVTETPPEGGEAATRLYTMAELANTLDVVTYDKNASDANVLVLELLTQSPLAGSMAADTVTGVSYLADNTTYDAAGYDKAVNLNFLWIQNGVSVNTGTGGGGSADDFFSITFYDWDGTTLLGTKIVPKTDDNSEQAKLIESALLQMQTELSATAAQLSGELWFDDLRLPLTYKRGYSFGKWIDLEAVDDEGNEVYTSYGKAVAVGNAINTVELSEPKGHVFSAGDRNGFAVKAAYKTNADLDALNEVDIDTYIRRNYTVSAVSYLQFADTKNYSFVVRIQRQRENEGKITGVHRVRRLGLRISMSISGSPVYMLQELTNQDDVAATIAVNASVQSVTVEVVDLCDVLSYGGTSNWATGAAGRSDALTLFPGEGHDDPGFILNSAIGYINDQCQVATASADKPEHIINQNSKSGISLAAQNYNDADLDINSVAGTTGGAAARRRWALANILAMYQSLPEQRQLTWDEMQEAVAHGTVWENGAWTNGFTGAYVP